MDHLTAKERSENMSKIRSKGTKPESAVRKILSKLGAKYRLHDKNLPGKPDIVLPKAKKIIFINGCFWHQHKNCGRLAQPKTSKKYWLPKLQRNIEKQTEDIKQLKKLGWSVDKIWECQTADEQKLKKIIPKILGQSKITAFKLAELFCGPGGLSYGAMSAELNTADGSQYKIKPVWANDIDEDTCRTYASNIHNGVKTNVVCGPVEKVNFNKVPKFDVLAFGFPCNDFSIVGEQKGFNGKYGPLYTYGVRAINIHNPKWFIAENVSGLQSANNGSAFAKILADLENAGKGYRLTAHLYKFEEYGVPQTRHRVVIIGIRKDLGLEFKVPAPTTAGVNNYVSAKSAIESPPIPKNAPNHEVTAQGKKVVERLKHIPPGKNVWYEGLPEHLRLNVKGARLSQIYKRLDPGKPSYTITGSGGGGTHGYHWSENRALTNRERARIQTFPDDFVFTGSKEKVRKQIGMAVPPKAAQVIIEAVFKTFAGIHYDWVQPKLTNGNGNGQNPLFSF